MPDGLTAGVFPPVGFTVGGDLRGVYDGGRIPPGAVIWPLGMISRSSPGFGVSGTVSCTSPTVEATVPIRIGPNPVYLGQGDVPAGDGVDEARAQQLGDADDVDDLDRDRGRGDSRR